MNSRLLYGIAGMLIGVCLPMAAQEVLPGDQVAFFEAKIRPVLIDKCYQCHAATSSKVRGGLLLDTREGTRRGGESGPAVVPGDVSRSLLIEAIHHGNKDTAMPPEKNGGKLPEAVIADFEKWVRMGAPDPREGKAVAAPAAYDEAKAKSWWAYQPVRRPAIPVVKNASWPRGDIDRFVLAGLEAKGMQPVGDADKPTLLRRVFFDLIGMPPSPETVQRFIADTSPIAFEKIVDELLKSPQFGERWGRHWLDVARYAESTGKDLNVSFPHAWRYRDYVIASFNKDKPYDQFIREQLAGDLLPAKTASQRAEQMIATGFLAIGPKGLGELTPRQFELDLADEQVDATTQAFLGMTAACARCHDHKFDPISQRDYYALAGIFLSTEVSYGTLSGPKNNQERSVISLPQEAGVPTIKPNITAAERAELEQEYTEAKERYDGLMSQRASPGGAMSKGKGKGKGGGSGPQFFIQVQVALGKMAELESRLKSFDENGRARAFCMGVQDRPVGSGKPEPMQPTKVVEIKGSSGIRPPSGFETIADSPLFARGEMNDPGERVPRGVPAALSAVPMPPISAETSGCRELAEWITNVRNPLTPRVMVNRLWHWLFGQGLVASVDNFGTMGVPPVNQPLLDHLVTRLVGNGWSLKATIREMVLSRSYQLASTYDSAAFAADPQNTLVWRHSKRRLDAEGIRDAMLTVSGELQITPQVGSAVARAGEGPIGSTGGFIRINEDTLINATGNYRSVYLPIARDLLPDALAVFDYSEASLVNGTRETTNVPAQALYLMNNEFVRALAVKFAERIQKMPGGPEQHIAQAYGLALARAPKPHEQQAAMQFFSRFRDSGGTAGDAWTAFCLALFGSAEFRFLN